MKSIIQSIRPEWVVKILRGEKTIEVRKRYIEPPFKVYIYCTGGAGKKYSEYIRRWSGIRLISRKVDKGWLPSGEATQYLLDYGRTHPTHKDTYELNGKVVAEYLCNKVEKFIVGSLRCDDIQKLACLDYEQMINYYYKLHELDGKTQKTGYAYHITDLKIYDKPKELGKFHRFCGNDGDGCPDDDCPYYETPSYEYGEVDYDCQSLRPVERPPQDFMYVEELK